VTGRKNAQVASHSHAGTGRLEAVFRDAGGPVLMPYAVGGYPDLAGSLEILRAYHRSGAALIEIGVPFSDPLADGPIIQGASQTALTQGVRPGDVLALAGDIAAEGAHVVLLAYLNTILALDPGRFFAECHRRGVLGVVIPDLPVEETAGLQAIARDQDVDVVLLAAPTSTEARLERIGRAASGFIYCVSTTVVTGTRAALDTSLPTFIERLRWHTTLPLAVGFGVSSARQAAEVAAYADGVIVGSALVDLVAKGETFTQGLAAVQTSVQQMQEAVMSQRTRQP
jgi:tryptophan synthase alpha chain